MVADSIKDTLDSIDKLILDQQAKIKTKQILEDSITRYKESIMTNSKSLDVVVNALELLREISDDSVSNSYKYIEKNINDALKRIFPDRVRHITLDESRRGNYPQLEIQLTVEDGISRSLQSCTGHGVTQVISLLSNMCLIVINGGRRFLVIDEVMSGMSGNTLAVMTDVLKAFAEIGFQYIIVEHGYIPVGSKVIVIESVNGVGGIANEYTEEKGVYMEGVRNKKGYRIKKDEQLKVGMTLAEEDEEENE